MMLIKGLIVYKDDKYLTALTLDDMQIAKRLRVAGESLYRMISDICSVEFIVAKALLERVKAFKQLANSEFMTFNSRIFPILAFLSKLESCIEAEPESLISANFED